MNVRLDWQVDEEGGEPPEFRRRWRVGSLKSIAAFVILVILILGAWGLNRYENSRTEAKLEQEIQAVLDLEHEAFLAGDGDLFFAYQDDDPAWLPAQLRPENQAANWAGLTVTRVSQQGDEVLANVSWSIGEEERQRVAFFQRRRDQWVHVPTLAGYWGRTQQYNREWGLLRMHEIDQLWTEEFASFVDELVSEICDSGLPGHCPAGSRPFDVTVADDFATTAAPNEVRLPSPRLMGLDSNGDPVDLFWRRLRNEVEAQLKPARVRFAIQEDPRLRDQKAVYEQLAAEFSASHEGIMVEIVDLADLPADPLSWPAEVDGAAVAPTQEMIVAGLVHDLTDFAATDPEFEPGDFFEQVWQGSQWRERMWFVPQAAEMKLVFYDKESYRQADLMEPSVRWTWEEMNQHINTLSESEPLNSRPSNHFVFMDTGRDALFSYAFNWNNNCPKDATERCQRRLQPGDVAAALDWYRQLAGERETMPDLTGLSPSERDRMLFNFKASIWVDSPVLYEFRLLLNPIGMVPFPGSDRSDGITPLWVEGSFISQHSQRPRAVWEWLKFLSYKYVPGQLRMIPARPSVAAQTGYWNTLPRPLGDAMRIAFPFAQPVSLEDQGHFSWSQLADVVNGRQSPEEAARFKMRVRWFGQK